MNLTNNAKLFKYYYDKIKKNNYAYLYYKEAYDFTNKVMNTYGLSNLNASNAKNFSDFAMNDSIFSGNFENPNSNFNQHRKEVIKKVIETNLSTAISGFHNYSSIVYLSESILFL